MPLAAFTFHYVSIKTVDPSESDPTGGSFTFHYVSIKTQYWRRVRMCSKTLHSTMSLLKQVCWSG